MPLAAARMRPARRALARRWPRGENRVDHDVSAHVPSSSALPVSTPLPPPPLDEEGEALTTLLQRAQQGDAEAEDRATRLVYGTLRALAAGYLRDERADHTLQPTSLVHEAYLRLLGQAAPWRSRSHFFGIAAQMMRRILVDHARRATALRRDRGQRVSIEELGEQGPMVAEPSTWLDAQEVLGVHDALAQMEHADPRQARVVELKFFVGLTLEEIAEVLGVSEATVSREWAMARAWLRQRLDAS